MTLLEKPGRRGWLKTSVALFLLLLPPACLLLFWVLHTSNIPYWDDLYLLDGFLVPFEKAVSTSERLALLFGEINGHKVVYPRLVSYALTQVAGQLNLTWLMLLGLLHWVGVAGLLFRVFLKIRVPLFFFLPVSILLFNPITGENLFFAFAAIQNYSIHLLILGSLYLLCCGPVGWNARLRFPLALGVAMLASVSSGTGLSVFFGGGYALLLRREYSKLLLWSVGGLGSYWFYTNVYHGWTHLAPPAPSILLANALYFCGSIFSVALSSFSVSAWLSLGFGLAGVVFFVVWSAWQVFVGLRFRIPLATNPLPDSVRTFCGSGMAYLLVIALSAALTKSDGGIEAMFSSRYSVHSLLLFALLYLLLLSYPARRAWVLAVALPVTALLFGKAYHREIQNARYQQQLRRADLYNWQKNGIWLSTSKEFQDVFPGAPRRAVQTELYRPPSLGTLADVVPPAATPIGSGTGIELSRRDEEYLTFYAPALTLTPQQRAFFLLYSPTRGFLLPAVPERSSLETLLTTGDYWQPGLRGLLPIRCVSEGILKVPQQLALIVSGGLTWQVRPVSVGLDPAGYAKNKN